MINNNNDKARDLYEEGRKLMTDGKYKEAITAFKASIKINPHFKALELLGECLMKKGKFKEAIIPLAAATTLNKQVRAPALLAEAMMNINERQNARDMAKKALSRDQNNKTAKRILDQTTDLEEHESK